MKHQVALAREALLGSTYGKFDLIADILPKDLLLYGKPRRIKEWLIKNLEITDQDINANTLRGWLSRYRNSLKNESGDFSRKQWQEFEPTITNAAPPSQNLIIKKVSTH